MQICLMAIIFSPAPTPKHSRIIQKQKNPFPVMQQALQGIRADAARNGVRYRKKGKYEYGKINFSPAQGDLT